MCSIFSFREGALAERDNVNVEQRVDRTIKLIELLSLPNAFKSNVSKEIMERYNNNTMEGKIQTAMAILDVIEQIAIDW
jgi:hypothetical protein